MTAATPSPRLPSTAWRERVGADEAARFERHAAAIVAMQRDRTQVHGNGRALHRKQLLGLEAHLHVEADLPPHARYGVFAKPGMRPAWLRLSNGSPAHADDRRPDIRGFAIKLRDVSGPSALGSGETTSQDFLLIQRRVTPFVNSDEFVEVTLASVKGPGAIAAALVKRHGLLGALRRFVRLAKGVKTPFSGFATEAFHSALPMACGPYAMRLRLLPPTGETADAVAELDWAADLRWRLAKRPLVYTLQAQFFVDEATTPIEDGSVDWPEHIAPHVTLARLVVGSQTEDKALAERIEQASFDPWQALVEHRPLGELMRARRVVYYASQQARRNKE